MVTYTPTLTNTGDLPLTDHLGSTAITADSSENKEAERRCIPVVIAPPS